MRLFDNIFKPVHKVQIIIPVHLAQVQYLKSHYMRDKMKKCQKLQVTMKVAKLTFLVSGISY